MRTVVKRINDEIYDTKIIIFFDEDEVDKMKRVIDDINEVVETFYVFDRIKNEIILYLTDGYYDVNELNKVINKYS